MRGKPVKAFFRSWSVLVFGALFACGGPRCNGPLLRAAEIDGGPPAAVAQDRPDGSR